MSDLFRLVFANDTNTSTSNTTTTRQTSYLTAGLALTRPIDYERLYRANETQLRLDVVCTDGTYESQASRILVQVLDTNDNEPDFGPRMRQHTIRRNESNLLQTLTQVRAADADVSAQYGNESLVYALGKCEPDLYKIYVDRRSGEISSKLIIDLDTDEIIAKRRQMATTGRQNNNNKNEQQLNTSRSVHFVIYIFDTITTNLILGKYLIMYHEKSTLGYTLYWQSNESFSRIR